MCERVEREREKEELPNIFQSNHTLLNFLPLYYYYDTYYV